MEVEAARAAGIDATGELKALMLGPLEFLRPIHAQHLSLRAITHFTLAKSFPVCTETSYESISQASGL